MHIYESYAVSFGNSQILNQSKGVETAPTQEIPVLNTCLAVGGYLAISTNLRYQVRLTNECWQA
jgi:hypothetical protein